MVIVPRQALALLAGEDRRYASRAASGVEVWRSFYSACGTPLFAGNETHPEVVVIKVGSLDDPASFRRQGHIWVASAPSWHLIEPDLPRAAGNPQQF